MQPNDPNVPLPTAPAYPPTVNDILAASLHRTRVKLSIGTFVLFSEFFHVSNNLKCMPDQRPTDVRCTQQDDYASILYKHQIIAQAASAAAPIADAPPWLHPALQQLRREIRDDIRYELTPIRAQIRRCINWGRGDGSVVAFDIVPFADGSDPTQEPHKLDPLHSFAIINNLEGPKIINYLNGYGIPLPQGAHPLETNQLRKDALRMAVCSP